MLFRSNQVDSFRTFDYPIDTTKTVKTVYQTLSPLYSMNKLRDIILKSNIEYDYWILTRPDVVAKNISLIDYMQDKTKLYLSYVNNPSIATLCVGLMKNETNIHSNVNNSSITTLWIGTQMVCGTKEDILNVTNIYNNLDHHLRINGIALCHHRLFYDALKHRKDDMTIINCDPNHIYGGWYWRSEEHTSELQSH